MLPEATLDQARQVLAALDARGESLATAESCTGGLIAAALTAIAGSSSVVMAGFVTYSNAAKVAMVGVQEATLAAHGAVSEPVARQMAEGALARAGVDVALSCTGVAGPGGGSAEKPVGLVFIARARRPWRRRCAWRWIEFRRDSRRRATRAARKGEVVARLR
jgi:nicotinamide-nucleotide amidase